MFVNDNNSYTLNKSKKKGSKKVFAILLCLLIAITGVITGIVFGMTADDNTSTVESLTLDEFVAVQTSDPTFFASPNSDSLVIKGTISKGQANNIGDSIGEITSGHQSTAYYKGNNFIAEIYDKRTAVQPYDGASENLYYLTSEIDKVEVYYQMGTGIKDNINYVFILKLTYNLTIISSANITDLGYRWSSVKAEYLACPVVVGDDSEFTVKLPSSDPESEEEPKPIELKDESTNLNLSSELDFWDDADNEENKYKDVSIVHKSKVDFKIGTDVKLSVLGSDYCIIEIKDSNPIEDKKVGVKIIANNLQSNIWVKAHFEQIKHTDTFNAYVEDVNGAVSLNPDYSLEQAGTATVEYYANGSGNVQNGDTNIYDTENIRTGETIKEFKTNISDKSFSSLSSNDVAKVTITPKEGYYISKVVFKYNGDVYNEDILYGGNIFIDEDGSVNYACDLCLSDGIQYSNDLNWYFHEVENPNNNTAGSFVFYYSGMFRDVEIDIVYKSETFINVQIDSRYTNDEEPFGNNALGITKKNLDLVKLKPLFDLFVKEIKINGNPYSFSGWELNYVESESDSFLAIKIPGSKNVQVIMQNDENKTAQISSVKNKAGTIITSTCSVSVKKDSMTYNALYIDQDDPTNNNSIISIYTVNDRQFGFDSYVGIGNGNYRVDGGANSTDSDYLYNYEVGANGVWSNVTVEYFDTMGDSGDRSKITAIDDYNNDSNSTFYGNQIVVTMKNINGYNNRHVILAKSLDVGANGKPIVANTIYCVSENDRYSSGDIDNYGSYSFDINGDGDFIVTFTLDYLDNNEFYIKTYYDAYTYDVIYDENGGTSTGNDVSAFFNVKPTISSSRFNSTKQGYTLMGYIQADSPLENVVSDGTTKPAMYYVSEDNINLIKYENGTSSVITDSLSYLDNSSSDIFSACYGWKWYGYQSGGGSYKLHKNLIQSAQSDESSKVYPSSSSTGAGAYNYDGATVTLYAVWHANNYEVHYDVNDINSDTGNGSSPIYTTYNNVNTTTSELNYDHAIHTNFRNGANDSSNVLPAVRRVGYEFLGWSYRNFYLKYNEASNNFDDSELEIKGDSSVNIGNYTSYILSANSVLNEDFYGLAQTKDEPKYNISSTIDINDVEREDDYDYKGKITLYAIWKPIVYTITVSSLVNGGSTDGAVYKDFNSTGTFDLNDLYTNGTDKNGSSPAIVYNNNTFKVQFDGTFKFLSGMTTTRVGYDFDGWKHFVTGSGMTGSVVDSTLLDYDLSEAMKLRSGNSAFYDDSANNSSSGAWVQVVPEWTAQEFTVYYSLANHTLRGYKLNRGSQSINGVGTAVVDDITFSINNVNMEYEGTTDGKTGYVTQKITFDEPFEVYSFLSEDNYNLDGWYYYYDGVSEPTSNLPFTSGGALNPNLSSYSDGITAGDADSIYNTNTIKYYTTDNKYKDTFNFQRYLFNARYANYNDQANSYASLIGINTLTGGLGETTDEDSNIIHDNDYYQSSNEANRKFTIFSDLSPEDVYFYIENREYNDEYCVSDDDVNVSYDSDGYIDIYQKDYEYNVTTNDYIFDRHVTPGESFYKDYENAIENDFRLVLTPSAGRYLKSLEIMYWETSYTFNFIWDPVTKTISIDKICIWNLEEYIGEITYDDKSILDVGQTFNWDNIQATLKGNGAYYVEDVEDVDYVDYGKTADIFGVYGEHYNHKVNNGATPVYDTNPVILDIIFAHNMYDGFYITPTWAVQTYDIEIYTLKVKDTNSINVRDDGDGIVGKFENDLDPNNDDTMGYLKDLFKNNNAGIESQFNNGFERIPAYKLVGVPYGYDLHAKYSDDVGSDELATFMAHVAEFNATGAFTGYSETAEEYKIWEKQFFNGYRFFDNFEFFTGYTKLDFIFESGTNINEIFIPTGGFKFIGQYSDTYPIRTTYTYDYKTDTVNNTGYYTIRELATRTIGSVQERYRLERNQTIYDNSVFFSVYVQTPKQSVVFHVFNPETKRYEAVDTGEDYVLAYWDKDTGDRISISSELVDGVKGVVKGMPSRNIGYWPQYINFNGYVVGPNLKQLYGYNPNSDTSSDNMLYNTVYVNKFFTNTFVELVNYYGNNYDDTNMYDITGLFDKFDSSYMIDHEIHVYAVYDYQQFNIDNDYKDSDDLLIANKWINKETGNKFTIGNNGDYKVTNYIKTNNGTSYEVTTNINLSWAKTSDDGSQIQTYDDENIKTFITNQGGYINYLSKLKTGATRETALMNVSGFGDTTSYTYQDNDQYAYIFFYLWDDQNTCRLIADNMLRINIQGDSLTEDSFDSQSTLIGIKIKSYNISNGSYTLELGGYYTGTTGDQILGNSKVSELWLNQEQFKDFVEATYNGKLLIDALRVADKDGLASGGETKQDNDEYMFLFVKNVSNSSIAMASTNFVRIKDGQALIYDSTDFFDVITYVDGAIDSKFVKVLYDGNSETIYANFSISVVTQDYNTGNYSYYDINNVAFVLLDELGFAEYQRLIDSGEIPEDALLQAAIFNNTNSFGNKTYVIPCLTDKNHIVTDENAVNINQLKVEENTPIHAVASTIMKYSGSVVWEIKSNGFRIVAARVSEHENPDYFKNESSDLFNTYYKDVNGDIVFEGESPKMNNNVFSYHINCIPSGANTHGFTVLGQTRYNEYIKLINDGISIEQALVTASSNNLELRDTEGDNSSTQTKGMKYIFVWFNATDTTNQSAEQIIVSSSIIVFNPEREMVTIKPAYNYFDISACFAKNVGDYIRPGSYDVKLSFDKDNNSIVSDSSADFDIYFTLNLGYGTSTGAYTKDDINYTILTENQYEKYKELIEGGSSKDDAITNAKLVTPENSDDVYIFAYLGEEINTNTIFASHIINLNTVLTYAILI